MQFGITPARSAAARFAVALSLTLAAAPATAADGVLLAVSGEVEVETYGVGRPAKVGLRVKAGDTVASRGGEASGILEDGRMFRVNREETWAVPGDRATGPAGTLASRLMSTLRETVSRGRSPAAGDGERGERGIRLLYPHNARVLSEDIRFEWEPVEGVDRVEITVKSVLPAYKQVFAATAGESGAFLPREAPPLAPGVRYYWKVAGVETGTGDLRASELAWFSVLDPEEGREMRSSMEAVDAMDFLGEPERNVLQASLLISHGLHHRAETILKKCLERHPGDRGVKELLAGLYLKMKRTGAAERVLAEGRTKS
ncbi:MAG: tetratricopeptide repeat protein [Deltaproteobacteria bacterium]|nr:tetratricopeptide repeat protein [Deltaproteobacteria bacterium]